MEIINLRELALKKVKIRGKVIGKFGIFEIEQVFKNDTKSTLEVGYTFPIAETATVVGFEINIGDKVLKGKCKEKGEAKKEYIKNIVKGNSAYLMEEESDNIFKISIGKIKKDEEVILKIHYIDKFEIIDNTIKILIPTLVTPKYKSKITNRLVYGNVNYTVDFNINIDKTLNIKAINSESHKINIIDEEKTEKVAVLNYDLSKDFKLNIVLKNEILSNATIAKAKDGTDIMYLSFMPEILDSYEDSEKEYLFIVDISGSMYGQKIKETKRAVIECLKQLDIGDKFNIIPFESQFEAMDINSIEYNEENMKKAIEYINNLQVLGGTEILDPIKFALYEKETDKIILLFTDGQVGNEYEIIKYVENNINRSRIFPFGIDTNVNASFIKQLAKAGNGKAELIQPKEKIDDKIIRTFARIQTPLLEKVEVDYGENKLIDEIREENCLFNYEFFNVFAKIEKLEDDIKLKGKILNKEYEWKIDKEKICNTSIDLEVLFAKQEIERLEEYIRNTYEEDKIENYEKMIIELSEKYNINSKYTSFITVYERKDKLLEVPKYQETRLSNKLSVIELMLADKAIMCDDENDDYEYEDEPSTVSSDDTSSHSDLDIPCFLRKKKVTTSENYSSKIKEVKEEKLKEKVDEYYKEFISKDKKSILTYLLYGVYYLENREKDFYYNDLIEFLNNNKEEILHNELYIKLIYLCYVKLKDNTAIDKRKIFELLNEEYKKIAYTNLKFNIDLKIITKQEIEDIIGKGTIVQNINEVIWYLYNNSAHTCSWLRY